jgi:D-tyrosyl-tRNA(Tyr) deacylase
VLLQRVGEAAVSVDGETVGAIGPGLVLLVAVTGADTETELALAATKVANLRIFEDGDGKMNRSALDLRRDGDPVGVLVVSQFTLYGDVRKGRRPSFTDAALPDQAAPMIQSFAGLLDGMGLEVAQGIFGAHMRVSLVNDGPVTIWIDTDDLRQPRRGASDMTP